MTASARCHSAILLVALVAVVLPRPASAQCGELVGTLFTSGVMELRAVAGGLTSRGAAGYRFMALAPDFNIAAHRFGTVHAARRNPFLLRRQALGPFVGRFAQFFPERGNRDVDSTSLEIHRDGTFFTVAHTWGDGRTQLANVRCRRGPQDQVLVTSFNPDAGWGSTHWNVVIAPGAPSPPPLYGLIDMHTHPMSYLGFGRKALHGVPFAGRSATGEPVGLILPAGSRDCNHNESRAASIEQALGHCNSTHGGWGTDNTCGDYIRAAIINKALDKSFVHQTDNPHGDHHHDGYPDFRYWPHHSSILHQQMWWEWLQRAYDGGVRVIVALTVNSEMLAEIINGDPPFDDRTVADTQIAEMIRFVNAHRFMEVARSADDLRRIVGQNRLAVVLGMEVDRLGNFGRPGVPVNASAVRDEIRRLHGLGVRYVIPVHLTDNAFGGAAVYDMLFNFANRHANGRLFRVETSRDPMIAYNVWALSGPFGLANAVAMGIRGLLDGISGLPAPCFSCFPPGRVGCCGSYGRITSIFGPIPEAEFYRTVPPGHVNAVGLTSLGDVAIREMMRLGMIVDVDHMSERSIDDTLRIAESVGYPIVMGHNGLRAAGGTERTASARTVARIHALGGMMGVGTAHTTPRMFLQNYQAVSGAMGGRAMGIGTDVNGFERLPRHEGRTDPLTSQSFYRRFLLESPVTTRITTGNKTWDYVTEGGVSHYGLLPEFIFDVRQQPGGIEVTNRMLESAETFAQVWQRCEAAAPSLR